ncbi:MAG: hypothetical protein PVF73_04180, partial [Bacteroidales bacterium]
FILIILLGSLVQVYGKKNEEKLNAEFSGLITFARYIEASIENGDPSFFNKSFDADAFTEKVAGSNYDELSEAFRQGFIDELKNNLDFGTSITEEIQRGGSYRYMNAYTEGNKGKILFRLLSSRSVNYHTMEVEITDIYVFQAGEKLSESIGRLYNAFSSYTESSENNPPESWNLYTEYENLNALVSSGKYKKACRELEKLPEEIKRDRIFRIIHIEIASQLDKNTFGKVYREYMEQFPEDPGKYLIPLDGLMLHNEYPEALRCVDSLDKKVFTDPLLDLLRANIYYLMDNQKRAIESLLNLIVAMPDFENGYFSLLNIYIEKKKYGEATSLLDNIMNTFNYYKEDFQPLLAEYPAFINSLEYKEWVNANQGL